MSISDKHTSMTSNFHSQLVGQTLRMDESPGALPQQPATRAFLNVIRSRADLGVHTFVDGPTLLGRDPACSIALHDFGVSRQHAVITPLGGGRYLLKDLGSTNGTRVNGVPIFDAHQLRDGEKILLGDTVLRFALADEMDIDFHSEVAALVSKDPLTGLPSKRRFDEALEFALESARLEGKPVALLMMDMDGVKQINDTYGHLFGAYVIGETGRQIERVLGRLGRACRFGGDEFSAFLPAHDLVAGLQVAEQIRRAVESAGLKKDGIPLRPTISIGVACYPESGSDLLQLVAMADRALYRAKGMGKNCVTG